MTAHCICHTHFKQHKVDFGMLITISQQRRDTITIRQYEQSITLSSFAKLYRLYACNTQIFLNSRVTLAPVCPRGPCVDPSLHYPIVCLQRSPECRRSILLQHLCSSVLIDQDIHTPLPASSRIAKVSDPLWSSLFVELSRGEDPPLNMSDDEFVYDSPYEDVYDLLDDADPAPELADDLAERAVYSPVWQHTHTGELRDYFSDWVRPTSPHYESMWANTEARTITATITGTMIRNCSMLMTRRRGQLRSTKHTLRNPRSAAKKENCLKWGKSQSQRERM